ncbi:chemotaxis protein CheC [Anaerobium acetethylicum]|uniref:Chemotaxis protein CheC n=1 Tax=Anaerobium acetethylicum TaxID=1619234 RepID=A0A1D3TQP6_9FIRM|nr:chemotaxis protein CheC [Anaerobium acetethylicum]SCP95905.1 chemotaxis protein CheC [Anaerobium acetethylicum]
MPKVDLDNMDSVYFDVLKEIGNIGAGNATTALAKLLNMRIDMKIPKVAMTGFDQLTSVVCSEEEIVVGIYLLLEGDVAGSMMFLLKEASAHRLADQLMGREKPAGNTFSAMDLSALQEAGNIIAGAYLSSLSALTNLTITASVPYISIDMAGAILSVPAIEFGKTGDKALLIETCISAKMMISGYFILIPELASYDRILEALGL